MNLEELLGGSLVNGAILMTAGTYLIQKLQFIPKYIWGYIVKRITYRVWIEDDHTLIQYLELWLGSKHPHKRRNVTITSTITNSHEVHFDGGVDLDMKYDHKHYDDTFVIRYKGKRLVVSKTREKLEMGNVNKSYIERYCIQGMFAKKKINSLMEEVIAEGEKNQRESRGKNIYTSGSGHWSKHSKVRGKDFTNIILKHGEELIEDLDVYANSETWYMDRSIAYKRGYLFYGQPGNGKSATCVAVAKHLNRHIYILSLNDIKSDTAFLEYISQLPEKSILVLEDIDVAFSDRNTKSTFSMSALFNFLDGAMSKHDIITIMTTNHPEKLDPALIREGRVDMKLEISNPEKKQVEDYLLKFYGYKIDIGDYKPTMSMSFIQGLCMKYRDRPSKMLKELYALIDNQE